MNPPVHKRAECPSLPRRIEFDRTQDESQNPIKYNHDHQKGSELEEAKKTTVRHIAILTIDSENK